MPFIVSIEGNIGSGKSTFIKNLKQYAKTDSKHIHYDIKYIQEPVDEWNNIKDSGGESILQKFYSNQEEYAFSFQIMAYITRLRKLIQAVELHPNDIFICERSLETDKYVFAKMLYDNKKIREIDWTIYNYWFNTFLEKYQTDLIMYIQTSPEICHKRIDLRNRKGEENIPLDYLQMCHSYHEKWLETSNVKILTLDGAINKEHTVEYEALLHRMVNIIPQIFDS